MLAIEVEYLLGRAVATDVTRRDLAEWPPHPARLFSALVDALADVRSDSSEDHSRCEAALRWLESLPPPSVAASLDDDISRRTPVKYWVPINDETADRVRAAPLVEQRKRQERFFPAVVPGNPTVTFAWPDAGEVQQHNDALDRLVARVPYLGHSSSLVRLVRRDSSPTATLEPAAEGPERMRVPGPGRLDRLNAVHALREKDTLVQTPKGREVAYSRPRPEAPLGPHGRARIVSLEGVSFGLEDTAMVMSRYRDALLSLFKKSASEVLTGHAPGGGPARRPHVAFVPLANVRNRFADGSIKGIAVVLPRDIDGEDLLELDLAMSRLRVLNFGTRGQATLRSLGGGREKLKALEFEPYASVRRTWVSVTPVALSLHPKPKKGFTTDAALLREFVQLGLPQPEELTFQMVPFVRGAAPVFEIKRSDVSSLRGRMLRHVHVRFPKPVMGPLLVGAGRHMGFGLLRPAEDA